MSVAQDDRLALTAKERLQLQAAPVQEVPDVYPATSVAVMQNHESLSPSRLVGKFDGSHWYDFLGINMYIPYWTADSAAAPIG